MAAELIRRAVRHARLELEMTQNELADRAGVSRQWIAGLESGRMANPRLGSITAVLDVLGLTLSVHSADPEAAGAAAPRTVAARSAEDESSLLQSVLDQNSGPVVADEVSHTFARDHSDLAHGPVVESIDSGLRVENSAIRDALDALKAEAFLGVRGEHGS